MDTYQLLCKKKKEKKERKSYYGYKVLYTVLGGGMSVAETRQSKMLVVGVNSGVRFSQ